MMRNIESGILDYVAGDSPHKTAYQLLLERNDKLRGLLLKVGRELDILRYSSSLDDMRAVVYRLLGDAELRPYLWKDESWTE
jgi:hypothetical protein